MKLSPEQRQIARTAYRWVEVSACPGSGKTTAFEARVEHLVRTGVDPLRIVVLSFSNAAVDNLKRRLARVKRGRLIQVQTCHAFARHLIQRNLKPLDLRTVPDVLSDKKRQALLGRAIVETVKQLVRKKEGAASLAERREFERQIAWLLEQQGRGTAALAALFEFASAARLKLAAVVALPRFSATYSDYVSTLKALRSTYRQLKNEANVVDYGDYLRLAVRALDAPKVHGVKFCHLLVDEWQDTSPAQARLVQALAKRVPNIMVVGDPWQALYGFAGATYTPLSELLDDVKVLPLSRSFRLNQAHADLATTLCSGRGASRIVGTEGGQQPELLVARSVDQAASTVANRVRRLLTDGVVPRDIAVLGRTRELLKPVARALRALGVLTSEVGPGAPASSAELTHLQHVIRLMHLAERGELNVESLATALSQTVRNPVPPALQTHCRNAMRSSSLEGRFKLCSAAYMVALGGVRSNLDLRRCLADWAPLVRRFSRAKELRRHVRQLASPVQISTIHGAKGLEWPYVFVVGVTDGLLPDRRATSAADLCAEANAMYVAATRASAKLTLVHAPTSVVAGRQSLKLPRLSRFIDKPKVLATLDRP